MTKALLCGYYGFGNADALTRSLIEAHATATPLSDKRLERIQDRAMLHEALLNQVL